MAKQKSYFKCTNCTYQTLKWIGCCPECKEWDSLTELQTAGSGPTRQAAGPITMHHLASVATDHKQRLKTGIGEWDRVMGGGIMPSSLIILTGDPGIGKSTLLLQVCSRLAQEHKLYYFSTEESLSQVKGRAERIACMNDQLLFSDQANLEHILAIAEQDRPEIIIIDSIQNCYLSSTVTTPGSVSQLREAAFHLMRLAKEQGITVIITDHITKDGTMAGPKTLEHMVDAVFYLQGEDRWQTRMLRSVKNRFGTINELGFFQMQEDGLIEVPNINQQLIKEISYCPGSVLVSSMEGSRPILLELQALTIESKLAMPQRVVSGVDHKQVVLIAAILQKYLHVKLNVHDIFFKVSGGFKVETALTDLGIALALLSSYFQEPLPEKSIALGEISLTGQIKPINQIGMHVHEAEKFGICQLLVAKQQKIEKSTCKVRGFTNVYELLSLFSDR
jgi:DNA repair protein RadA/Sms